jgi:anti-anti-sigma factor
MKVKSSSRGSVSVYELSGHLFGHPDGYAFLEEVRKKIREGASRVVVDMSAVDRIDSSGIGVLAAIVTSVGNAGGKSAFARISDQNWQLLEVVGLSRIIGNHPTVDAAVVAALGSK